MKIYLFLALLMVAVVACNKQNEIEVMENPDNTVFPNGDSVIGNSDFETGDLNSWNLSGDVDASYLNSEAYSGNYCLRNSKELDYQVKTSQTITDLPTGYYSITIYSRNSGGQNACYIYAKNFGGNELRTSLPVSNSWTKVIIRGIHITNGQCEIGLYSNANGGNWCNIDNFRLTKDDIEYEFIKGGDISLLNYLESKGGKFYLNGTEGDCMDILKEKGYNCVRLRLYNDPGNPDFHPSDQLPAGFQNTSDMLSLAKRAVDKGMQIELTFHYSDYWTNAGTQYKPHEWENYSFEELKTAIWNYTHDVMSQMQAQGTTPQFVSLGNESGDGILFPDGQISISGWSNFAELINSAYNAVKDVSTETQVILHLAEGGDYDLYNWFFGECESYGINYDIIGSSYYPFWTGLNVTEIQIWANEISSNFGKKILIMETGYNWNPTLPGGWDGQLHDVGPYEEIYGETPEGQRDFLYELFNGLKACDNGNVIGDLYWDPILIEVPGVGWIVGGANFVSNTTLFDFDGNALPALDAYLNN